MGATGSGPFENDDALDFLDALAELPAADRGHRVLEALDGVLLATRGSTEPTKEPSAFARGEPALESQRWRAWRRALSAEGKPARKLAKLLRDPERFFADARSPVVRRVGGFLSQRLRPERQPR